MTIVQLEYFLAIATHGSFVTAAENCFVSPSALSMQISALENELGVTLLDRNKKPIVPTEAGEAFGEQARKAVVQFHKTKEVVNDIKGDMSGTLRIGVIPTINPYLIPLFIPPFTLKCPNIRVRIYDMYTTDLVEALAMDNIDIGILSGGQSAVKIKETELFDDKLYMYVSPENELFGRPRIEIRDIDVRKLLILSDGNCLRNQTLELCEARRAADPPFDFVRSSLENLMLTVDNTSGTTVIPSMAIHTIPEDRRRQIIPFATDRARRKITMAISHTFVRESLIDLVRETILEVAAGKFALSDFLVGR